MITLHTVLIVPQALNRLAEICWFIRYLLT